MMMRRSQRCAGLASTPMCKLYLPRKDGDEDVEAMPKAKELSI